MITVVGSPVDPVSLQGPYSDAAFQAAIDANPGDIVQLPPGTFRCQKPLVFKSRCVLQGYAAGAGSYLPTILYFDDGVSGLQFIDDPVTGGAQGSRVQDLTVRMLYRTIPGAVGISSNAGIRIERCYISGFSGDGIVINGQTPGSAANLFQISDVQVDQCLNGVHISGGDSNAGLIQGVSCTANTGWGFIDESGLGNTYVACHTRTNVAGPYKIGVGASGVNASLLLGCYAEGDQPPSQLGQEVYWLGGTNAAGVTGGQLLLPGNSRLLLQGCGNASVPPLTVMAGAGMECPVVAIQDASGGTVDAFGPTGTLLLGTRPGAKYPEDGDSDPPLLSIWPTGSRPAAVIGVISPPGGPSYVAPVAQIGVTASGNNYGDAHLMVSTMTAQSAYQQTLTLGNGGIWAWDGKKWKSV